MLVIVMTKKIIGYWFILLATVLTACGSGVCGNSAGNNTVSVVLSSDDLGLDPITQMGINST